MTQTFHLPSDCADRILCYYANDTYKMKIARITNIPNFHFERVVFPGERLLFEAPSEAQLKIYISRFSTSVLVEVIACDRLVVKNSQPEQNYVDLQRESFIDESDAIFSSAEKFIVTENCSRHLVKES